MARRIACSFALSDTCKPPNARAHTSRDRYYRHNEPGIKSGRAIVKVGGIPYRTIWVEADGWAVRIIDQTGLPHEFVTASLKTVADAERAIRDMLVRGAPLIGATGAYGMALAAHADPGDRSLEEAFRFLAAARPTAVNLRWGLERMREALLP